MKLNSIIERCWDNSSISYDKDGRQVTHFVNKMFIDQFSRELLNQVIRILEKSPELNSIECVELLKNKFDIK